MAYFKAQIIGSIVALTFSLFQTGCLGGVDNNNAIDGQKGDETNGTEVPSDAQKTDETNGTADSPGSEAPGGTDDTLTVDDSSTTATTTPTGTDTLLNTDIDTATGDDGHITYDTDSTTAPYSTDNPYLPYETHTESPDDLTDTAYTPPTDIPEDAETTRPSRCENNSGVIFWDTDSEVLRWGRPGHYDYDTDSQWEDSDTQWTLPVEPDTSSAFEDLGSELTSDGPACDNFQLESLTPRVVSNLFAVGASALDVSTEHVTTFGGPGSNHVYGFSTDWHPEWTSQCMGYISDGVRHTDGTYYVLSDEFAQTASTKGIRVSRLRENGTFLWSNLFGNSTYTVPYMDIIPNARGGVFVSAHADNNDGGQIELKLLSIDADGKLVWINRIPLPDDTRVADWSRVATTLDANGDIVQITPSGDNMRFIHTSKNGQPIADVPLDDNAWPQDIFRLPGGDMLLIANKDSNPLLMRLSLTGQILQRPEVYSSTDASLAVGAYDPDSGYIYLGGEKRHEVSGIAIGWHLVLDTEFNVLCEWQGGKLYSSPSSYVTLPEGGIAFSERHVFHVSAISPK